MSVLEGIMLNEIGRERSKCDFTCRWNLKQSQSSKQNRLLIYREQIGDGRRIRGLGLARIGEIKEV